ncbi:MAG: CPP1-like family protein [Xenococcaceae cyanobacterium]
MSEQNPYEKLGVTENASFEEIQDAKKRLSQQYRDDSKAVESIEAAYDAIIMERLKLRQEGKIKVPERIRFPERSSETPPNLTSVPANNTPAWLQQLIDTPSRPEILWPAGVFLVLAGVSVFSQQDGSLPSFMMALGVAANIYFLNRKEHRFGRSLLITLIGLILGIGLGMGLANLLDIQSGGFLQDDQFASLVTFCLFWLISSFLR